MELHEFEKKVVIDRVEPALDTVPTGFEAFGKMDKIATEFNARDFEVTPRADHLNGLVIPEHSVFGNGTKPASMDRTA